MLGSTKSVMDLQLHVRRAAAARKGGVSSQRITHKHVPQAVAWLGQCAVDQLLTSVGNHTSRAAPSQLAAEFSCCC